MILQPPKSLLNKTPLRILFGLIQTLLTLVVAGIIPLGLEILWKFRRLDIH